MSSGWDVYYVVFLSAVLGLGLPLGLKLLYFVFSRREPHPKTTASNQTAPPKVLPTVLGQRINARFFLAANAALILIALAMVLIPIIGTIQAPDDKPGVLYGMICIVSVALLAALGLLYSARKGDLSWVSSFEKEKNKGI